MSSAELRDHVRLACVPGIGSRLRRLLLERFGSPEAVFAASPAEIATVERIGPKLSKLIPTLAHNPAPDEVIALCKKRGVDIILEGSPTYPALLSRIDDPPGLLFVHGTIVQSDALAVAIVGARHATAYGLKVAEQLGASLARAGYTVVSGLARGIDAAAHRGALGAGGRTLAILGSGVLNIYPPEHADLAREVIDSGAVISELPPLMEPLPGTFPQRNRIVSGLSLGVVVVQAADRSGALITARLASEQGREVFAVPGAIDCRMSRGCHKLIRDGAKLVESVDDILEEFGPLFETTISADGRAVKSAAELQLGDIERQVLDAYDTLAGGGSQPVMIDAVVDASGLAASQVLATIGVLEMRRLIRRLPGSQIARA
ncbi:MAG: DNA-processing protein DprA [Planctomycetota bacterium]